MAARPARRDDHTERTGRDSRLEPFRFVSRSADLVAGIAGGILHIGLFFVPALVALAVGGVKLWREQP